MSAPSEMTTLMELIKELQSLRVTLEGVRVTLDSLCLARDDHEARVRVLEQQQQAFTPIAAAVLFLLGSLATAFLERWL